VLQRVEAGISVLGVGEQEEKECVSGEWCACVCERDRVCYLMWFVPPSWFHPTMYPYTMLSLNAVPRSPARCASSKALHWFASDGIVRFAEP